MPGVTVNKLVFVFVFLAISLLNAQVKFEQNPFEKADPFRYQSARNEFWKQVEDLLLNNQFEGVILLAGNENIKKIKSIEKAEVYLAVAEVAVRTDHPYLAFILTHEITKIFPLSNQALRAYFLMEEIIKKNSLFDELIVGETIIEQDINLDSKKIPHELKGFLAYAFFQSFRQQGFVKWEKIAQKGILPNTEWAFRLDYDKALYELYNDRFDNSLKLFEGLKDNELASDYLRKKAKRQFARLIFEKGEFQKSFDLLKELQFEQDDRGFILLERAWTKYYLKHYSKSLGLLTALDNQLFASSRTPETDILKMLIYKELCHYDEVFVVKKAFDKKYRAAIDDIKNRKDLAKNEILLQLSLMKPNLKSYAGFIGGLRRDFNWIKKIFPSGDLLNELQTKVRLKDRQLQDIISLKLNEQIRKTADEMLDWNEQINFLDYQTRVDSLRLRRSDIELNYRPEAIPLMTFDRLYWLYKGEMWLDELENLRVLVKSKCQKAE